MKNKFMILIPIIACLLSCNGNVNTGGQGNLIGSSDIENNKFYENDIVDFSKDGLSKVYAKDSYSNGTPFGCTWSNTCVKVENDELKISIKEAGDIPYVLDPVISGEIAYRGNEGENYMKSYGYYSCTMKPAKGEGVVSAFFLYSNEGNKHNEIDIEFLGKNTKRVQFNYYVDNEPDKGHEFMYNLPFDYSEDYHKYGFLWTSEKIVWYIDNQPVYEVKGNVPTENQEIISNLWTIDSNNTGGKGWAGTFDTSSMPLSMYIKNISYVSLEEIEAGNYEHYNAVPATLDKNGCKEHWINKNDGKITFDEPSGLFINIEEKPSLTYDEISSWESNDPRIELKYKLNDNQMVFGTYPQTRVMDNVLKARLKHEAGGVPPTTSNYGNWKLLPHYSSGGKTKKMFYQDVYDEITKSKYRGIYLLENRTHDPVANIEGIEGDLLLNQSTQYKNEYYIGRYYWFKYEPIVWDINSKSSSTYILTSNLVLDAYEYDYFTNSTDFSQKGNNSYVESTLREFLNSEFKDTAFTDNQLSFIKDYKVDDEFDKVLINSETNIFTYYPTSEVRQKSPTSYALAMGAYSSTSDIFGKSFYWTKSSSTESYKVMSINENGVSVKRDVWYTNTGVLPCISLDLGGFTNE